MASSDSHLPVATFLGKVSLPCLPWTDEGYFPSLESGLVLNYLWPIEWGGREVATSDFVLSEHFSIVWGSPVRLTGGWEATWRTSGFQLTDPASSKWVRQSELSQPPADLPTHCRCSCECSRHHMEQIHTVPAEPCPNYWSIELWLNKWSLY